MNEWDNLNLKALLELYGAIRQLRINNIKAVLDGDDSKEYNKYCDKCKELANYINMRFIDTHKN